VAHQLQREIGLDRRAHIARTAVVERPAAIAVLSAAQIAGDFLGALGVAALQKMLQQDVFGRDGRIRFEIEAPMAVAGLPIEQGLRGTVEAGLLRIRGSFEGLDKLLTQDVEYQFVVVGGNPKICLILFFAHVPSGPVGRLGIRCCVQVRCAVRRRA